MKRLIIFFILLWALPCYGKDFSGLLGIKLGEQIVPYAEGHYTGTLRKVKGEWKKYLIIIPPIPLEIGFGHYKYAALMSSKGRIIELKAEGRMKQLCNDMAEYKELKEISETIDNMEVDCRIRTIKIRIFNYEL